MSISIKKALLLEYAKEMKLIAGENGIDNLITTVGILDHEIIEKHFDVFERGEFVISTLSVARDDDALVFFAIKELIKEKVAGLAIKSVYYSDLPQYIKEYANAHNFPIFVFDTIFIEHLITSLTNGLQSKLLHEAFEIKLETIFKGNVSKYLIQELAYELNSDFLNYHQIIYCKEKRYLSDNNTTNLVERYLRANNLYKSHGVYRFRAGIIIIMTSNDNFTKQSNLDLNYLIDLIGLNTDDFIVGKSDVHHSLESMDTTLKEAYYAYKAAEITNIDLQCYSQIGIYQLLIPLMNDPWAIQYSKKIIEPIINYDLQFDTHLYETLKLYFLNGCNTKLVSEVLFQHKNTILYRLKKVKELTGPFTSDQDFKEQLSIAIKLYEAIYQSPENNM